MKLHRNTVWLIPLILILTFPLWRIPLGAFLVPKNGLDQNMATGKTASRNFSMDTVKILQNQEGQKTALIRARSARTNEDAEIFTLETVDADIFDADGNKTHIVSKTGKYNVATKILTLVDDVVVNKTHDEQFLYTDLLYYDSDRRTVNCPGKTRLVGKGVKVDGGSLDYDIETSRYDIGGRVHVVLDGFTESASTPAPQTVNP